jgi:hypothetical protein
MQKARDRKRGGLQNVWANKGIKGRRPLPTGCLRHPQEKRVLPELCLVERARNHPLQPDTPCSAPSIIALASKLKRFLDEQEIACNIG